MNSSRTPAPPEAEPVVIVGAGLAGLATALGVALGGRRAIVLEAADLVGGAAAYSGGLVWVGANHVARAAGIDDDVERAARYVRGLAAAAPDALDERAMWRWLTAAPIAARHWEEVGAIRWALVDLPDYHQDADGAIGVGRTLTNAPIDGAELGAWRPRLRVSPYFPVGTTYDQMLREGRRVNTAPAFGVTQRQDERGPAGADGGEPLTFGTGVVASFLARILREERVELRVGHRVTELLADERGVVGARADGPDGPVELRGPVVLATSSFDWDPELVRELLGLRPGEFGSVAPPELRGDGLRLARAVGGDVARIPATAVPMLPGWPTPDGGFAQGPEYAKPHAILVDAAGRRFCDDSYWVDIVARALAPGDRHLPFFLIADEQHHRRYGLGATPPGAAYPDWLVTSAPTLEALAERLGIDAAQLTATVARFNEHARRGEDPEFGRGTVATVSRFSGDPTHEHHPVLGPIAEPPFHGVRMVLVGTGIGSSGIRIDGDGRVLTAAGEPIAGLHAVGSCAALTSSGVAYNSGFPLSRAITLAHLVSRELVGEPLPWPADGP
jgi:3-oxosteroid 1-dehydrogenase